MKYKNFIAIFITHGFVTTFRAISNFFIAKVVAIYAGPSGMALLGQAQNAIGIISGVVTSPLGNGIVRFTAESNNTPAKFAPWWGSAIRLSLLICITTISILFLFSSFFAKIAFNDTSLSWLLIFFAATTPFYAANTFITSVLNGFQDYKHLAKGNIISITCSTILMVFLVTQFGINGAVASAGISSAISGLILLLTCLKKSWLRKHILLAKATKNNYTTLIKYLIMALLSATCYPLAQIFIRNILVEHTGWQNTGYWQAVYKISEAYLMIITLTLGTYYLPRLSKIKDNSSIKIEVFNTSRVVIPIVSSMALLIYLLRDIIITTLFTESFRAARDLFGIQLVGDVFKILSWVYAYPMQARGAVRWFAFTEILFSISLFMLSYICIKKYGTQGANIAFLINNILYFITLYFNLHRLSK